MIRVELTDEQCEMITEFADIALKETAIRLAEQTASDTVTPENRIILKVRAKLLGLKRTLRGAAQ